MLGRRGRQSAEPRIERVFREERGRILATLIRVLGDFDLAEEALAEALEAALRAVAERGARPTTRAPG